MLRWRFLVSFVLIPLLGGIFYLDAVLGAAAPLLLVVAELLALRAVWELAELFRQRAPTLHLPLVMGCAAGVVLAAWYPHLDLLADETFSTTYSLSAVAVGHSMAVLVLLGGAAARYRSPGGNLENIGIELLIVTYAGLLVAVLAQLRWVAGADAGYVVLVSLLVCAKGGDIGAFTAGKLFGRNKLSPVLSPGKTWEGAIGGVTVSVLCSWLWLQFAPPLVNADWSPSPWPAAVAYGVVIGSVGIVGDLCESLLKRDVGKKDSATLLPGFGGALDILDSVVYAGPVALLLWEILPLATWE